MEIIHRGTPEPDRLYDLKCSCGTVAKFKRREARFISDQRDGDCLLVRCPICGKENYVDVR